MAISFGVLVALVVGLGAIGMVVREIPKAWFPLTTRQLPGLEIASPFASPLTQTGDYANGEAHAFLRGINGEVDVRWQVGTVAEEQAIAKEIEFFARKSGFPPERVERDLTMAMADGTPTQSWGVVQERTSSWYTHTNCGRRRLTIGTDLRGRDGKDLQRRMVVSLRCRPDAAEEERLDDMPLVLPQAAGWFRMPRNGLAATVSDGKTIVRTMPVGSFSDDLRDAALTATFPQGYHQFDKDGDEWPFEAHVGDVLLSGWIAERRCPPDRQYLLMSVVKGDRAQTQAGRAILQGARCRNPGEPAQVWSAKP